MHCDLQNVNHSILHQHKGLNEKKKAIYTSVVFLCSHLNNIVCAHFGERNISVLLLFLIFADELNGRR